MSLPLLLLLLLLLLPQLPLMPRAETPPSNKLSNATCASATAAAASEEALVGSQSNVHPVCCWCCWRRFIGSTPALVTIFDLGFNQATSNTIHRAVLPKQDDNNAFVQDKARAASYPCTSRLSA
jgi:hypothetical protein